ncbi:hypothetical protein [Luteolibacter sp.]|uniref:hypothetical protein n=1 Tax=Luteolibacter sp. TaxID=1962973 RepID=UPI0032640304
MEKILTGDQRRHYDEIDEACADPLPLDRPPGRRSATDVRKLLSILDELQQEGGNL